MLSPTPFHGHNMFRRLSALALAAALAGGSLTAAAQRVLADFSGVWDVVVQGPQGPMASSLNLSQTGDSVSGKFESEVGAAQVKGGVKGDSLEILFALDVGGQVLNLQGLGALKEKDKIEGKIVAEGMGEFPFTATRQSK